MEVTWEIAAAIVAIVVTLGGVAVRWITSTIKAAEERRDLANDRIEENQHGIKDDLSSIKNDLERRVEKIQEKIVDFRSGETIDKAIDHARRNGMMALEGVKAIADSNTAEIRLMRDRLTVVETKHESTAALVAEVKIELKETRGEINERFDQMTRLQNEQFQQLCASIREVREIAPRQQRLTDQR